MMPGSIYDELIKLKCMQNRLNRGFACIFNCWQSLSLFEIPTHPIKSPILWVFLISK